MPLTWCVKKHQPDRAANSIPSQEICTDPFIYVCAFMSQLAYANNALEVDEKVSQETAKRAFEWRTLDCTVGRGTEDAYILGSLTVASVNATVVALANPLALDTALGANAVAERHDFRGQTVHVHRGAKLRADAMWRTLQPQLLALADKGQLSNLYLCAHSFAGGCATMLLLYALSGTYSHRPPCTSRLSQRADPRLASVVCKAYLYSPPACITNDLPTSVKAAITSVVYGHDAMPTLSLRSIMTLAVRNSYKHTTYNRLSPFLFRRERF